jgi:hypothetical protein
MHALLADKQSQAAQDIIAMLKLEINTLKRKLKEGGHIDDTNRQSSHAAPHMASSSSSSSMKGPEAPVESLGGTYQKPTLGMQADNEVDQMISGGLKFAIPKQTGGNIEKASTFQKWKIEQFLYAPDTPAASKDHDLHTVDMLAELATMETLKIHYAIPMPS